MSRQYFADVIIDPPIANLATLGGVSSETNIWNPAQFTPIHAYDAYKSPGKIYKVFAGGIMTTAASTPGTLTVTPRVGNSGTPGTNITMGASQAATLPTSLASQPWFLEYTMVVRTTGAPGVNSTMIGTGYFSMPNQASAGSADFQLFLGGTSATADLSIESAIALSATFSATTNTMTPMYAFIQSLN